MQNTGTAATPAGFLINQASIVTTGSKSSPRLDRPVINGQIVGEAGTVTGIPARDLLVAEFGTAPFSQPARSTAANYRKLRRGAAEGGNGKPTDVQLTGNGGLGDGLFGNEGDIDDGESGDGGDLSSPISPPVRCSIRGAQPTGDVDDPVSGAGNPSLTVIRR